MSDKNTSSMLQVPVPHVDRLSSAHVLILGGSSGIGFAIANLALSSGATVVIAGSQQAKVDEKVTLLRSLYPYLSPATVSGHAINLSDSENLESNLRILLDGITSHGSKKLDHIAFTAGDHHTLPALANLTLDSAMQGSKIRLLAPLFIAKLLTTGSYMPLASTSSFTLTGGVGTTKPLPGWLMPAVWGASAEGLSRGLAVDLAPLRVNIVKPGAIETEMLRDLLAGLPREAQMQVRAGTNLLGAFGRPEDVAEAYAWIMRDRFVTGTEVAVDGGQVLLNK